MKKLMIILSALMMSHLVKAGEVEWVKLEDGPDSSSLSVTGRVVPEDGALNIESARVAGRIVSILRREGEYVNAGTSLYSISSAECFSLMEERKVALSKQIPELIDGVEKRETQLSLKIQNNDCLLTASHAGVMTKRNLDSGASFNSGDPLATVLDTRRMTVELDIPEKDQQKVHVGQKVQFHFASMNDSKYQGTIQTVVPTIDPVTRTFKVRLSVKSLPRVLALEELVFGDLDVGHGEKLLKAPSSAVVFHHDKRYLIHDLGQKKELVQVYVVNENEKFSLMRPVQSGTIKVGALVAVKGAVFLLKSLTND
ncbi:MAG: efflux RND transporter periplasmic adaptor subunit [Bacillota bacterium]